MGGNREIAERFIASLEARDWEAWTALLHPDAVYEIPQSRERIRGRDRYLRFNQEYPGDWHLRPKVVIADEQHGVVWFEWDLEGHIEDAMEYGYSSTWGLHLRGGVDIYVYRGLKVGEGAYWERFALSFSHAQQHGLAPVIALLPRKFAVHARALYLRPPVLL